MDRKSAFPSGANTMISSMRFKNSGFISDSNSSFTTSDISLYSDAALDISSSLSSSLSCSTKEGIDLGDVVVPLSSEEVSFDTNSWNWLKSPVAKLLPTSLGALVHSSTAPLTASSPLFGSLSSGEVVDEEALVSVSISSAVHNRCKKSATFGFWRPAFSKSAGEPDIAVCIAFIISGSVADSIMRPIASGLFCSLLKTSSGRSGSILLGLLL
mmetsp:Transcript_27527/g.49956  ORF Transcript_27527/g.49956 Transcript_27527/m.49956 type:complete len:213 (-) Transcript_27527:391-1029(-)